MDALSGNFSKRWNDRLYLQRRYLHRSGKRWQSYPVNNPSGSRYAPDLVAWRQQDRVCFWPERKFRYLHHGYGRRQPETVDHSLRKWISGNVQWCKAHSLFGRDPAGCERQPIPLRAISTNLPDRYQWRAPRTLFFPRHGKPSFEQEGWQTLIPRQEGIWRSLA